MKLLYTWAAVAACVAAQPQIGGGTCNASTLNGSYTALLNGRDLDSSATVTKVLESVGTATFDGQGNVSLKLTMNTNQSTGVAQSLAGKYSLQPNCMGSLTISTGDTATFALAAYNQGASWFVIGQDSDYSLQGSGSAIASSCSTAVANHGPYLFSGTGYGTTTTGIASAANIVGLLTLGDGPASLWYLSIDGATYLEGGSGGFAVSSDCTGTYPVEVKPTSSAYVPVNSPAFYITVGPSGVVFNVVFGSTTAGVTFLLQGTGVLQ